MNLSIHPSSACLSLSLSSHSSYPDTTLSLFQPPLTFSPTFTASLRFAPCLGHPLFALHTEARTRNEQLPLDVLSTGSPNPRADRKSVEKRVKMINNWNKLEKIIFPSIDQSKNVRNFFFIASSLPESLHFKHNLYSYVLTFKNSSSSLFDN